MGDTAEADKNVKLRVLLPGESAVVRLIRNGKLFDSVEGVEAEFVIEATGVYRVEVYLDEKAWIFSNHIRIINN